MSDVEFSENTKGEERFCHYIAIILDFLPAGSRRILPGYMRLELYILNIKRTKFESVKCMNTLHSDGRTGDFKIYATGTANNFFVLTEERVVVFVC